MVGTYESEVKQPDLNKTKQLKMRRYRSCKDSQLICVRDIMNQELNSLT